ncbi:MAG: membrane dipeptidase [Rubellimicrobium sp.]|nr:membrane dipeptidase [Rubellimicrobium sp.]
MTQPVFDGHNDFLMRLMGRPAGDRRIWRDGDGTGQLDGPRAREGGLVGGLFAIYVPSPAPEAQVDVDALFDNPPYDMPLPDPVPLHRAQPAALSMAGHLRGLARDVPGFRLCRTADAIETAMAQGDFAAVMHMEGAEAIDEGLDALHVFHGMGLRSLGPVWSRPTVFGHGVPFAFPSGPDTGPGLTDAGRRLVRECNLLRILIDLSHMNEKGFDDVAALSDAPLVATHSNAHAVTPSSRNLTDRQLAVIRDSGGLVGLNYATAFLRPDGRKDPAMGWDVVLRHLDHLLEHLGEEHVGLGSDFDGAVTPAILGDVTKLPDLVVAMRAHGYDQPLIDRITHGNWIALLRRTWGE